MKTLFKVILVMLAISLIWNMAFAPDIHIHGVHDYDLVEISGVGLLIAGLIVFAVILAAITLFSAIWVAIVIVACVIGSILFAGLTLIWPFVLFGLICYWIFKDNDKAVMHN